MQAKSFKDLEAKVEELWKEISETEMINALKVERYYKYLRFDFSSDFKLLVSFAKN